MAYVEDLIVDIRGWYMKAHNIVKLPKWKWEEVGGRVATRIVKDADKGIGADGKKFDAYSTEYKIKKSEGRAAPKGVSASRQTSPPNLRLTGTMLNSISAQNATTTGVEIILRDGLKIEGNAKRGRDLHGVNPKNEKKFYKDISDHLGKNIDKYAKIPIEISVG